MKKVIVALGILLLLTAAIACASAVELKADKICSFADNILTVTSEEGGILTIEAASGTVPLENPVTEMPVDAGEVGIPWKALTYGGEPLMSGETLTLRATLACKDRTVEQTEIQVPVGNPVPAVLCCLPVSRTFYPDGRNVLKIECATSYYGVVEVSVAPKDDPDTEVWHFNATQDKRFPLVVRWDGKGKDHQFCKPGDYIISAWSRKCSDYVHTAEITLLAEPPEEPELTVTGSLIPEDLSDDAAVWEALCAPVVTGYGEEGSRLWIMADKTRRDDHTGSINCRTVGVSVLEIDDDGWVKIGAWRQEDGLYTEGWVKAEKLVVVRPNTRYGAVVNKKTQTMTVYENGKKLGETLVSTGLTTEKSRKADTHGGAYLLGTRMERFRQSGRYYDYPIRIDRANLIHQAGYYFRNGGRDFEDEIATLGAKASHGCIRIDPRITEENGGINAWWVWTHLGHDTKIIVVPDE